MQNWDTMQPTANYVEHNSWYNNIFSAAQIKTEPGILSPTGAGTQSQSHSQQQQQQLSSPSSTSSHLENYLKSQQQHFASTMESTAAAMTPSPSQNETQFFEQNMQHHQQLLAAQQQQQYQQHFQQAQQAAAQNHVGTHLPLGFNPLTPPGLPNAVLPAMSHFYQQSTQQQQQQQQRAVQQTPSPQPTEATEKSALTPRHTPPMDITPPKSPKPSQPSLLEQQIMMSGGGGGCSSLLDKDDHDLMSNSSEDIKYLVESEDDENIRLPIYNSHGKMKNHKCKTCGMVAITKMAFWEHARSHMKPEKILQCPKCPFVTELKHHLEYHIRKHKNLKPFQCDKCSYSCVNKSMLNSHRKSHSSVYQYRCADCDYATKYCHSFKLHLRKYEHKPGMVLDEEGIPNPSVIIDVYGTRRGPKNKSSGGSGVLKKACTELKMPPTSQLSAALQGFPMPQSHQMPASPAKSNSSSVASDLPGLTLNMSLQQQHQQHQQQQQQQQQAAAQAAQNANAAQQSPSNNGAAANNGGLPNLLPPLASLLQQNQNMAFFPYWNLNLQMLAAQQQAAVLAQLSPRMREQLQKQQQEQAAESLHSQQDHDDLDDEDDEDDLDDQDFDRKSVDSAMDLSQGTPTKEEQQTPEVAMNLKLAEGNDDTPLFSSTTVSRRKGRVLKLDQHATTEQHKTAAAAAACISMGQSGVISVPSSPVPLQQNEMPTASSPIGATAPPQVDHHSSADESMETDEKPSGKNCNTANTSASSTASSSGNSSNSSSASTAAGAATTSNNNSTNGSPSSPPSNMYECKYCDIYFKDAVLYTIHMGYHSCDDVFKCNMCGEKCDGPVGLFVHMARNAHS